MNYQEKFGLYLSVLGGVCFSTGVIASCLEGSGRISNFMSNVIDACFYGGIVFFFIGLSLFSYGVYKSEIKKIKEELNKK
jgi:hypothetical protein